MPAAYYVQPSSTPVFRIPPNATRPLRIRPPVLAILLALMPALLRWS